MFVRGDERICGFDKHLFGRIKKYNIVLNYLFTTLNERFEIKLYHGTINIEQHKNMQWLIST